MQDGDLSAQARENSLNNFRLVFARVFERTIVRRMDENAGIFRRISDDREFQDVVREHYLRRVFERARADAPSP
jgi:hypothetical protein